MFEHEKKWTQKELDNDSVLSFIAGAISGGLVTAYVGLLLYSEYPKKSEKIVENRKFSLNQDRYIKDLLVGSKYNSLTGSYIDRYVITSSSQNTLFINALDEESQDEALRYVQEKCQIQQIFKVETLGVQIGRIVLVEEGKCIEKF